MAAEAGTASPLLGEAAAELWTDTSLSAVLGQLLRHSRRLVGAMAGSVSLVDAGRDRYAKLAEYGASCQVGRSFPLAEGVTGQVMARRGPVTLASYGAVRAGHLPVGHPASHGAVAAVPIWWLGDVIGANVVFAGRGAGFTTTEVDELEMLTQEAAPGIVRAGPRTPDRPGCPSSPALRTRPASGSPPTAREAEVLALVSLGLSDREVAATLTISRKTVEKHVAALLRKTGTTGRVAAVMRSLEWGWVSSPIARSGQPS